MIGIKTRENGSEIYLYNANDTSCTNQFEELNDSNVKADDRRSC